MHLFSLVYPSVALDWIVQGAWLLAALYHNGVF